ncbi:MAG TPA: efflux RND transporter permease subunit [Steroidobacteraceae bacterium]|jgi:multidrug efflux pump|nr:efflux RND transporter permease subunit [Steroidobacteraceae bacterium]
MSISTPFIRRPVATTLLSCGLALVGIVAYFLLPVASMPEVDFPAIVVQASLPGASPDTVATSVTTPLERHLSAVAGVDEMTSSSSVGSARVVLVFDLSRDIHGAESDVQSAIEAARADLPTALRQNPTYRAFNPADAPVLILALTSNTLTTGQVYDAASTVIQQKLLQLEGVGDVSLGGSSLPAVRIDLNPQALFKYGIGLEDVRAAISAANANSPKGAVDDNARRYQVYVNDTATTPEQFRSLIIAYRDGAAVHLGDLAQITNGVEDVRNLGLADGPNRSVLMIIRKQPGANVIDTVNSIKAVLPQIQASVPAGINIILTNDRTASIRASVQDVETTLLIALALVVTVVLVMLRNPRAAIVPAIAVPLSLVGTFVVMYLLGFSLNNLSLMALTVATGFVVDDAIVVIENISRHVEAGVPRLQAAIDGASEVSFTVLSMSCSLIAVFIPILLMGGLVGRELREFATTLSVTVVLSLIISLTTTPMLCGRILRRPPRLGRVLSSFERGFDWLKDYYGRTLADAIRHPRAVMLVLLGVVVLNFYLFAKVPKGFFPEESSGSLFGGVVADQSISFQAMQKKMLQIVTIVSRDPAVDHVVAFTGGGGGHGGGTVNTGNLFTALKPLDVRKLSDAAVLARLRRELSGVTGARLFLQSAQDIHFGGRQGNAAYQYTLLSDDLSTLDAWTPKITAALQNNPALQDVSSDREAAGLDVQLQIDRATAARLGVNMSDIDNTLYDAFGQRLVSTIYEDMNQYYVVMEVAPQFWQSPDTLKDIWVSTQGGALGGTQSTAPGAGSFHAAASSSSAAASSSGTSSACGSTSSGSSGSGSSGTSSSTATQNNAAHNYAENQLTNSAGRASTGSAVSTCVETMVPLSAFSSYGPGITPLTVNHQGPFVATTFSFNLPEGEPLGSAVKAINATMQELHVPITIQGSFAGTAKVFQQTISEEPLLVLASLIAVYIVLGVLYESLVQPITILSTLPSSGIGAVLALLLCGESFTLIALIAVILLIGIVLKNAIMMVDVALETQRAGHDRPEQAIHDACLLRFRPILMTTMAAMLGALPLAVMSGQGSELRRPLGIAIVGGLFISQILTLYTTPVVYIYLDRFRLWSARTFTRRRRLPPSPIGSPAA